MDPAWSWSPARACKCWCGGSFPRLRFRRRRAARGRRTPATAVAAVWRARAPRALPRRRRAAAPVGTTLVLWLLLMLLPCVRRCSARPSMSMNGHEWGAAGRLSTRATRGAGSRRWSSTSSLPLRNPSRAQAHALARKHPLMRTHTQPCTHSVALIVLHRCRYSAELACLIRS